MNSTYTKPKLLAIAFGALSAGWALVQLLAEPISTGHFELASLTVAFCVVFAIGAGHLVFEPMRENGIIKGAAFSVLFLACFLLASAASLYTSVGNQHAKSGDKAAGAEQHNAIVRDKRRALQAEEDDRKITAKLLAETQAKLKTDCVNGKANKAVCDGLRSSMGFYERALAGHDAVITRQEAELQKLGGTRVAHPKAEALGRLATILGWNGDHVAAVAEAIEPFCYSVIFELFSIACFGFGFSDGLSRKRMAGNDNSVPMGTVPVAASVPVVRMRTVSGNADDVPPSPRPGNRSRLRHRHVFTKAAAEADVVQLLARGEQLPSQETLRARWGLAHRSLVSKWLGDFEARGLIVRQAEGRCKAIRAATA